MLYLRIFLSHILMRSSAVVRRETLFKLKGRLDIDSLMLILMFSIVIPEVADESLLSSIRDWSMFELSSYIGY